MKMRKTEKKSVCEWNVINESWEKETLSFVDQIDHYLCEVVNLCGSGAAIQIESIGLG